MPAAVVVTTKDTGVPPHKQRELAHALHPPTFDVPADHAAATANADLFNPALLAALDAAAA